jgi:hypothetical protein
MITVKLNTTSTLNKQVGIIDIQSVLKITQILYSYILFAIFMLQTVTYLFALNIQVLPHSKG